MKCKWRHRRIWPWEMVMAAGSETLDIGPEKFGEDEFWHRGQDEDVPKEEKWIKISHSRNSAVFYNTKGKRIKYWKLIQTQKWAGQLGTEVILAQFISYTMRKTHVLFKIILGRPFTKSWLSHSTLNVATKYIPPIAILILRQADIGYTESVCRTQKISSTPLCGDIEVTIRITFSIHCSLLLKMKAKTKTHSQFSMC